MIIGHYYIGAYCKKDDVLSELTDVNFNDIISRIPVCHYDKNTDKSRYSNWKSENLPVVYFTIGKHRPDLNDTGLVSNYAVIDIDNTDGVRYESSHPSVCCANYTGSGTHLFIHTNDWGKTPQDWLDTYNSIAYEIWCELCNKYKCDMKFDGSCAKHTQGCYLWNTEWIRNEFFDRDWTPTERYITDNIIDEMYDTGSYRKHKMCNSIRVIGNKGMKNVDNVCVSESIECVSSNLSISNDMIIDFKVLSYKEFIDKYSDKYTRITGTVPVFENYTDYLGSTYKMYKTNGQMTTLWNPFMQSRKDKNSQFDYKIKVGGRRRSLASHLIQACQFMNGSINPDNILYDAVCWIFYMCEKPYTFKKYEIISQVTSVLKTYDTYESRLVADKRMFVTGDSYIDTDTGETVYMDKGMKIAANARCRKTERIIEVVSQWKPEESIDWNVEHIKSWEDKSTKDLKKQTFISYIESAKSMPELIERYKWLESFKTDTNRVGKPKERIRIEVIETGEVIEFESKTDCIKWLGCSSYTFSRFLNGLTKLNKIYKIV